MSNKRTVAVAALILRDGEILLVQQQGREDPAPSWALPGGVVESDELLGEALSREIREETGLILNGPGPLLYAVQVEGVRESWVAFVFGAPTWNGTLQPADPDEYILDARFLPVPDAIAKLEAMPIRCMREPILAYLRDEVGAGALWCYRRGGEGSETLVECVPGSTTDR